MSAALGVHTDTHNTQTDDDVQEIALFLLRVFPWLAGIAAFLAAVKGVS